MQANVSVESVESELGSASACSRSPQSVAAIDEPAVLLLSLSHWHSPGSYIEIAVDLTVDALKAASARRVSCEVNNNWAVHGVYITRPRNRLHANSPVDIADIKVPGGFLYADVAAIDCRNDDSGGSGYRNVNVIGHVVKAAKLAVAAAVFAIAAPGCIIVNRNSAGFLFHVELYFGLGLLKVGVGLGTNRFVRRNPDLG